MFFTDGNISGIHEKRKLVEYGFITRKLQSRPLIFFFLVVATVLAEPWHSMIPNSTAPYSPARGDGDKNY